MGDCRSTILNVSIFLMRWKAWPSSECKMRREVWKVRAEMRGFGMVFLKVGRMNEWNK